MKILMVLTSHDELGSTGEKTGFWLEEFSTPYYIFKDVGAEVVLASPAGGQPPLDPKSDDPELATESIIRFHDDPEAQRALAQTVRLAGVVADDFDAIFYPGGHGPLWDLAEDKASIALIEAFYAQGKPVGAVCHAPGVLRHASAPDGSPLVQGKKVTGFSNAEEAAVGLSDVVPFRVEEELRRRQGRYSRADEWQSHCVADGNLITGQNPASSAATARELLRQLGVVSVK